MCVCNIIKIYSGSCPCLCLVNNANRQADNIVITRCLFICLCLRTRSSFCLCPSRAYAAHPVDVCYRYPSSHAAAERSRLSGLVISPSCWWRLCVTNRATACTCGRLDTARPQVSGPVRYTRYIHTCTSAQGVADSRTAYRYESPDNITSVPSYLVGTCVP